VDGPGLFVGIDLGGSGTRAALVEADGTLLATGRGPTGLRGGSSAGRQLARALDAALAPIASRVGSAACAVFAGTRGLSVPGRRERLELELTTRFRQARVQVANDALVGFWGGLAGQPGVAVVAGAGSIAFARDARAHEARAGGGGYLLGDEGSGFWIGREALRAYLGSLEGRHSRGPLCALVADAVGRADVVEVLAWFHTGQEQVERMAALAPLVSQAAGAGDAVAVEILARAGCALAEIGVAAARQVFNTTGSTPVDVVQVGGVWAAGGALEQAFVERLDALLPDARRTAPRLPPVGGAVLLAMGANRDDVPPDVLERLRRGLDVR
jgi:N-acetylglucosamine kinase-like BadF-type ATPase